MSAEHSQEVLVFVSPTEEAKARERNDIIASIDVDAMQHAATYNPDNEVGRVHRRAFREALPEALLQEEVTLLSVRVAQLYPDSEQLDSKVQIRFLTWLGDSRDETTAKSAQEALSRGLGLRGKIGAVLLTLGRLKSW